MVSRRFVRYDDIPATLLDYLITTTGINNIYTLSLPEINTFFNDMEHWYENHSRLQRFSEPTD